MEKLELDLVKYIQFLIGNFLMLISLFMLFKFNYFNSMNLVNLGVGFGKYSFMLIFLSLWIFSLVIMSLSCNKLLNCLILTMILLMNLILFFATLNFFLFYMMFESSLILMLFIILKWGGSSHRLEAGYYMMFYTFYFSLPLLIFLFQIEGNLKTMDMMLIENFDLKMSNWYYLYMMMSFFVKIPLFMLHAWLLKAHVEAPVFGSMILASILLKMGTYGMLQMMNMFFYKFFLFKLEILIYSVIGCIMISMLCLRQLDMKILVAYSSVVHMGLLISSMLTFYKVSVMGGFMTMISHGLCSSGLFYLVNLNYQESGSRMLMTNKGMINYMPKMSLMWFLFCSSNMAAPISLNLMGEIMMLMGLLNWSVKMVMLLMMIAFFSFVYSLYLYSYVQHGEMNFYMKVVGVKFMSYVVLLLHWIPLNFIFLNLILF